MPTLSRWFVKTGLVYFVASLLTGVWLVVAPHIDAPAVLLTLQPVYFHLFLMGWVSHMIIGVSHWFFPRSKKGAPRGNESLGWFSYASINVGLVLRGFSEPLVLTAPGGTAVAILVISAILQWSGSMAYVMMIWPRVRPRQMRES